MAFNFMSGNMSYDPFSPYQQSFYNDPRRRGAQGSFNPYALSNFGAMKGGQMPADSTTQPPPTTKPAPQLPTVPSSKPPNASPYGSPQQTKEDVPLNPASAPPPKPAGTNPNSGAFNYGQYGSAQDVYAHYPGGLPDGWDWAEWARVTGQPNPLTHTASGEPITFTWNPDGPGYINPQTGETYDKPGETYPMPPPQPRPAQPIQRPNGWNWNGLLGG